MDRIGTEPQGLWAAYVLGVFIVVAPQILGGATPSTELTILILGNFVTVCCAGAFRNVRSLGSAPFAACASLLAALWTLLQALPVPCAWLAWAQPERVAITDALGALGTLEAPRCALSLSPGGTLTKLALAATLAALVVSATAAARAGHRGVLSAAVALSSVVMACVAVGHGIADADEIFGIYKPRFTQAEVLLAPLMNENHLAGHLALGFPLCLAFTRSAERVDLRILWGSAAALVLGAGLLSFSRGGAAVLIGGGAAAFLLTRRRRRRGPTYQERLFLLGGALSTVAVAVSLALTMPHQTPETSPFHKLFVALKLGSLTWSHPFVGIGRGALGDLSTQVAAKNGRHLFAENFVIQWAVEWGIPAALAIAALFGVSFAKLRAPQRLERALACGFFALLIQNLVDFSLELAGVACVAAVALGALVAREHEASIRTPLRTRPLLLGSALLSTLCLIFTYPWFTRWARPELQRAIEAKITAGAPAEAIAPLLNEAFRFYPLDPAFLVLGTALAVREQAETSPRWLNLAFSAAPGWAAPHLQAALYLERIGQLDQAAIELSLALVQNASFSGRACAFVKRHPRAELVWSVTAPGTANELQARQAMTDCLVQDRHWAEAERAARMLLERFPRSEYGHRVLVKAAANQSNQSAALAYARAMLATLPEVPASTATVVEILAALDRNSEAIAVLDRAPPTVRVAQDVLLAEANVAARAGDDKRLERALQALLDKYGLTTKKRAELLLFAAQHFEQTGNHIAALTHARAAYDLNGNVAALELAHHAALKAGMISAALRTAAELCNVGHRGKAFCGEEVRAGQSAP